MTSAWPWLAAHSNAAKVPRALASMAVPFIQEMLSDLAVATVASSNKGSLVFVGLRLQISAMLDKKLEHGNVSALCREMKSC